MEIRPIVSSLLKSRTGPLLVALQVAISLAILANAIFVVQQRIARRRGWTHLPRVTCGQIDRGESRRHDAGNPASSRFRRTHPRNAGVGRRHALCAHGETALGVSVEQPLHLPRENCHSERSEESSCASAECSVCACPSGFFAALRMTVKEFSSPPYPHSITFTSRVSRSRPVRCASGP